MNKVAPSSTEDALMCQVKRRLTPGDTGAQSCTKLHWGCTHTTGDEFHVRDRNVGMQKVACLSFGA
eukprot:scaffold93799_cov21-Tisochrysis_lutea.AAC.2